MLSEVKQMCIKADLEGLVLSGWWFHIFLNVYPYLGKDPI